MPEAQLSSSISKKPIQFLEWLKELKFISLSFRALFIKLDDFSILILNDVVLQAL